jgi:hypothetical protein
MWKHSDNHDFKTVLTKLLPKYLNADQKSVENKCVKYFCRAIGVSEITLLNV